MQSVVTVKASPTHWSLDQGWRSCTCAASGPSCGYCSSIASEGSNLAITSSVFERRHRNLSCFDMCGAFSRSSTVLLTKFAKSALINCSSSSDAGRLAADPATSGDGAAHGVVGSVVAMADGSSSADKGCPEPRWLDVLKCSKNMRNGLICV